MNKTLARKGTTLSKNMTNTVYHTLSRFEIQTKRLLSRSGKTTNSVTWACRNDLKCYHVFVLIFRSNGAQKKTHDIYRTFQKCCLDPYDDEKVLFSKHISALSECALYNALLQSQQAAHLEVAPPTTPDKKKMKQGNMVSI